MNDRDFDLLSAFLDGQLSATEKSAFEARLSREDNLRATLKTMRGNRRLMRALPLVKPPRRFTLTPAQARAMQRPAFFPMLQFATAFAALCFVVVFTFDAFSPGATGTVAMAPERQSESLTTGNVAPMAADADPESTTLKVAGGSTESGGGSGLSEATPEADAGTFAAVAPPPEASSTMSDNVRIAGASEDATPAFDASTTPPGVVGFATMETEVPPDIITIDTYSATMPSDTTTISALPYAVPTETALDETPTLTDTPWLRYATIGFAALTLLLALSAWWMSRR